MKKRIRKGEYGYIKFQRKIELCKTILMLLLSVGIYRMGIYSTGSNQNLLTFVAVLGCLPMAKFAVNFVLFTKASGCSEAVFNRLSSENIKPMFYDLFYTTAKKNFQISVMDYKRGSLIMLSEDVKVDVSLAEEHLKIILKNCGYENVTVKLYTDVDKFILRLNELKALEDDNKDISVLVDNLLSVSI